MLGPDQLKIEPVLADMASSVTVGDAQPYVPPFAVAPGGVELEATVAEAVAVQPFWAVTVTT